ncbi:MAG: hypothetical protein ACTH3E_06290 [Psychroflexus halocasei]
MHIKIIFFSILTLVFIVNSQAQNHFFGIKAGYTKSMPSKPDNQVNFNGDQITIEEGVKRFKGLDGFQIGIYAFIDVGSDFLHLDFTPHYSRYGFQDKKDFIYDYVDFDLGVSNYNSAVPSKLVYGFGFTPSLILKSEQIENINDFDLKAYLSLGYRFYKDFVISTQLKYGVLEIVPESKITNLQFSLNLNIPIFKIEKT